MPSPATGGLPGAPQAIVRRHDPDRYLTALFAPAAARPVLFTLYAFNHELARAREAAREPGLALIRLQWWREVVEGAARAHEVAAPLHAAIAAGRIAAPDLLAMIEAREQEIDGFETLAGWRGWLMQGAGSLAVAAGRVLGAPDRALDRLRALGAGYGAAGVLRSIAVLARQGRCLLPQDALAGQGLDRERVIATPDDPRLAPVCSALAAQGRDWLGAPRPAGGSWLAAGLPAVLARRDLRRAQPIAGPRPIGDRIAVTLSALRGRC